MSNPYEKHMPGFSFVSNGGPGNNFSHQDCPRVELWADLGRYLKETGEIWEIFIPLCYFLKLSSFPETVGKCCHSEKPSGPVPFLSVTHSQQMREMKFILGEIGRNLKFIPPQGTKGSSENGRRLQEGPGKDTGRSGCL